MRAEEMLKAIVAVGRAIESANIKLRENTDEKFHNYIMPAKMGELQYMPYIPMAIMDTAKLYCMRMPTVEQTDEEYGKDVDAISWEDAILNGIPVGEN